MQLLASWKQSLGIFYPLNNLKLFGFAIVRAVQVAVPQFLVYGGWLVVLLIVGTLYNVPVDSFVLPFFFACLYLIVRPSVGIKSFNYVKEHWHVGVGGVLLLFALTLIAVSFSWIISFLPSFLVQVSMPVFFLSLFLISVLVPLWFFFFFDSRGRLSDFFASWKRAFLMALYAFPVWLCIFALSELVLWASTILFLHVTFLGSSVISILVWVLLEIVLASTWSVFYTKRLHEQFELYFPGPQIKE